MRQKNRYRIAIAIAIRSVELIPPLPDGHLYLAAYLDRKRDS